MAKKKKVAAKPAAKKKTAGTKAKKVAAKKATAKKPSNAKVSKSASQATKKGSAAVKKKSATKASRSSIAKKPAAKKKTPLKDVPVKESKPQKKVKAKSTKSEASKKSKAIASERVALKKSTQESSVIPEGPIEDRGHAARTKRAKAGPDEAVAEVEEAVVEGTVDEEIIITDAEGRRYCRVRDCDQIALVDVYCRYHYLAMWKRIQQRRMILSEGKLEKYIEELTSRYSDKYLEIIRKDLRTPKDFMAAIQELEIDENQAEGEFEEDEARSYIEEMRGVNDNKQEDDY